MPEELQSNISSKKKPVDVWLTLGGAGGTLILFLIPKTPLVVIIFLIIPFILFFHLIWNFWWIEERLWRRICAITILIFGLIGLGYYSWPSTLSSKSDQTTLRENLTTEVIKLPQLDLNLKTNGGILRKDKISGKEIILYQRVVLVNKSEKNMSLSFLMSIRYEQKNNGKPGYWTVRGKWIEPNGKMDDILSINKQSTLEGQLIFELPPPYMVADIAKTSKLVVDFSEDQLLLQIYDRITGIRLWCDPTVGHPPAKEGRGYLSGPLD